MRKGHNIAISYMFLVDDIVQALTELIKGQLVNVRNPKRVKSTRNSRRYFATHTPGAIFNTILTGLLLTDC